jgi:integrase
MDPSVDLKGALKASGRQAHHKAMPREDLPCFSRCIGWVFTGRATVHGFRTVASTLLNEMGFHPDWIERQLAHDERNKVRAAYNHAQYLPERRRMMQQWADYLDTLKAGAKVIPLHCAE